MTKCAHAASGCNYPVGECSGACMTDQGRESRRLIRATMAEAPQHQPAAPQYLTIVYRIHSPGQRQSLLHATDWTASSHSHAIQDRDRLRAELNDVQDQRRDAFRTIERLNDELGQACEQQDEYAEAILAMVDREDNDCMPAGWSMDRVRVLAQKIRRSSNDRAVRRSHDEQYLAHDVKTTRTGKAT